MRKIILSAFTLFLFGTALIAQGSKKIDNHTVWGTLTFSAANVYGVESMLDGIHFTKMGYTQSATTIDKYTYQEYKKIGTIVSSADLKFLQAMICVQERLIYLAEQLT